MRILVTQVRQSFRVSLQSEGGVVGVCLGHGGRRACFIVSLSHCFTVSLSYCPIVLLSLYTSMYTFIYSQYIHQCIHLYTAMDDP